jgi:hypothetical protein
MIKRFLLIAVILMAVVLPCLYSPVAYADDPIVVFSDANLNASVRAWISIPTGDIHQSDLLSHDSFTDNIDGVVNLSGMEYWTSLVDLRLGDNSIVDISPLASLTSLTVLELGNNEIVDIPPLASLTSLNNLHLEYNNIVDVSPLVGLTLSTLQLEHNNIVDISYLVDAVQPYFVLDITDNPLNPQAYTVDIPSLLAVPAAELYYDTEPVPTVASILPDSGTTLGGTPVTITGTNFLDGATVTIGGNPCTNVSFVDAATLTAVTPAGTGNQDVVVTNAAEIGTLVAGYEYIYPPVVNNFISTMAWVVVLVSGAFICLVLLTYGAGEALKGGNTELIKAGLIGFITFVIAAIIVAATL